MRLMSSVGIKNTMLKILTPLFLTVRNRDSNYLNSAETIPVNESSLRYLIHSSFNVMYINDENATGYFRECRKHSSKIDYFSCLFEDYYNYVLRKPINNAIKMEFLSYFKQKNNLNLFFKMGVKNDCTSAVAKYFSDNKNTSVIGIPNNHTHELSEFLPNFIQFVWGEIYIYQMSNLVKRSNYQICNSNKQIATYKISQMLQMNTIIPNTKYVILKISNGLCKFGTLMDIAPGIAPEKLNYDNRTRIHPFFQKQIMNLNLLDLICRHTDHRPGHDGNYNVIFDSNNYCFSVSAFDNDAPTSFFLSSRIDFVTSAKTTPFINTKKIVDRPFLPKSTVEIILELNKTNIDVLLKENLSWFQRYFLFKRIVSLKKAIIRSNRLGRIKILDENQWNESTITDELKYCSDNSQISYLSAYVDLTY